VTAAATEKHLVACQLHGTIRRVFCHEHGTTARVAPPVLITSGTQCLHFRSLMGAVISAESYSHVRTIGLGRPRARHLRDFALLSEPHSVADLEAAQRALGLGCRFGAGAAETWQTRSRPLTDVGVSLGSATVDGRDPTGGDERAGDQHHLARARRTSGVMVVGPALPRPVPGPFRILGRPDPLSTGLSCGERATAAAGSPHREYSCLG